MHSNKSLTVCVLVLLGLTFSLNAPLAKEDNPNDLWELAWASEFQVEVGTTELLPDLPAPYRAYLASAWYDFDGDYNDLIVQVIQRGEASF